MFDPITRLKHPAHYGDAYNQKTKDHGQAYTDADIGHFKKTPAKTTDEINHRVEQCDRLPERWQHAHRVETAAKEYQWGNN